VTAVVLAVHAALIGAYVARGHDARDFARVAPKFANKSSASEKITADVLGLSDDDPQRDAGGLGYDGQFNYFMALDPKRARYYMDDPAYRYARPLYPAVSRLAALGRTDAIPPALLVVNWLAIAVGTAAFALLMCRNGLSTWLALLYGLAPGLVLAVHRDVTEPLAYALAMLGVLALSGNRRRSLLGSGVLFGLAGLARQTTLLFPLAYGVALLLEQRDASESPQSTGRGIVAIGGFFVLALAPYIGWTLAIHAWLGDFSSGENWLLTPFGWLFEPAWAWSRQPPELIGVVIPTCLWLAVVVNAIQRKVLNPALACAGVAAIVFVAFGPTYTAYPGSGRAVLAVAIPALVAAPALSGLSAWARRSYWVAVALWFSVLPGIVLVDLLDVTGPGAG
jgi:hypothetical protein